MPTTITLGGIVLAVLGLLVGFAGLPDRSAGLGLGSDLIQAGASIFAGGIVVAALGQVLKSVRDMGERVEDAVYELANTRNSLNDELAEEKPRPLPRAAARTPIVPEEPEEADEAETPPPAREPRATRPAAREAQPQPQPAPAPRAARPSPEAARPQPRPSVRQEPRQTEPDFDPQPRDEDATEEPRSARTEPRWMRAQAETNNRNQPPGVIPLSNRPSLATPAASTPRREMTAAPMPDVRRRPSQSAPAPQPAEPQPEASVVRSGIIAGMAYTLYSDGSIEAELPAGLVRFGSLTELQDHVKRAGADDQNGEYGENTAQR